jgi:hypothetical protein
MYPTNVISLPTKAELFYKDVLRILNENKKLYLIGGSLALAHYMHLPRPPKDLDIFLRREDVEDVLQLLANHGYETLVVHSHWLAKAYKGDLFIDFIFNSGNGIAQVDDTWFDDVPMGEIFGLEAPICRPEDIIWSKAFIMDRERFDGADIAHLIRDAGKQLDWQRLLNKFEVHWRVLLSHVLLYQFIYPGDDAIPDWVVDHLVARAAQERAEKNGEEADGRLCQGTLLSRDQYASDVDMYGYADGRLEPVGNMTAEELDEYLSAVDMEVKTRKKLEKEVNIKFNIEQQHIANKVRKNKRGRNIA